MKTKETRSIFYVYEHWRPDKDVPFYVGKGHDKRAWDFCRGRNRYHKNVVAKLNTNGLSVDVRIICEDLTEADAHSLEITTIAYWRGSGVELTNRTNGGEGVSGLIVTQETRQKLSDALTGRTNGPPSPETRAKIGAAHKGRKKPKELGEAHSRRLMGRKLSDEHRRKIGEGNRGGKRSEEARRRMSESQKGRKISETTRLKLIESHKGNYPSDATRAKMSEAQKRRWDASPDLKREFSDRWSTTNPRHRGN